MAKTTTQRARRLLTERDMALLRHVAEFGGAEIEPLHRRYFGDRKIGAAKSTLRRLTGRVHRVLRTTPLDGTRVWYQLTHKGARVLGLSHEACRQFGCQARARRYALQWFLFVEGQMQRRLCNLRELPDLFPIRG
ncbi:MAG: hypothetical protein AB8G99_07220, partial [Planctomycetaceae bacterium]